MAQFYESVILIDLPGAESWGIQALASPPQVNGVEVDYSPLLAKFRSEGRWSVDVKEIHELIKLLGDLANPIDRPFDPARESALWWQRHPGEVDPTMRVGTYLFEEAVIASEASPVAPRSIMRLAGEAASITFLIVAGAPTIVISGTAIGLVVLRGLGAVGGALWRGAEPNVELIGERASAKLLDAICLRMNLAPITKPPPEAAAQDSAEEVWESEPASESEEA